MIPPDGEELVEPLEDAAIGKYFTRLGRAAATLRGRVAQDEPYFQDQVNRDNQVNWTYFYRDKL